MNLLRWSALAVVIPLTVASSAPAQTPTLEASRTSYDVVIDGRLDEPAWETATLASGFTQSWPRPGAPGTERTEVRVLFDDHNLYVGLRMYDSAPDSIAAPLARRDARDIFSDWVHVAIDSRMDRRSAFRFTANPRGVKRDAYHSADTSEDESWQAVWEVGTQIDSQGWVAEFRIPLSQLRFGGNADDVREWGFQIIRDIARIDERTVWAPWSRNDPGFVSRFGTLTSIHGVPPPRGFELVPYVSPQLSTTPAAAQNPLVRARDPRITAGADVKAGLPRGLTLSATLNPDFGQVEADPAEVNLTAFETFLEERRPFFTEGADMFRFGDTRAFSRAGFQEFMYSRRIGGAPQRHLVGEEYRYVDAPGQTRILGAGKLTGRTPDGWSLGIMNALTAREQASFISTSGDEGRAIVEPLTNYLAVRPRRDLRGGASTIGAIATAVNRDLDPEIEALWSRGAYVGGIDFLHTWSDRVWTVAGYFAGSSLQGHPAAILRAQHDPVRYLQRPDADYLSVDIERTSLAGHISEISLVHAGSWDVSLQLKQVSPGFDSNEIGFHGRVDSRSAVAFVGRRINRPVGFFREHSFWVSTAHGWNYGSDPILRVYGGNLEGIMTNFWRAGINARLLPEGINDRLTRGGPAALRPRELMLESFLQSDTRQPLTVRPMIRYWGHAEGADEWFTAARFDYRPLDVLRLQASPQFVSRQDPAQFVTVFRDPSAESTFGSRYVFGELRQTTFSLDLRLDWTFSPTLSLQIYAQPFVSAGSYDKFKEFAVSRTFDFDVYGVDSGTICRYDGTYFVDPVGSQICPESSPDPDDSQFSMRFHSPDFNVRSLRGNAVLRWEYRPGSTLFFVWQQDRSGFLPQGDFDFGRDVSAIFRQPAHHVFLIKATFWMGS